MLEKRLYFLQSLFYFKKYFIFSITLLEERLRCLNFVLHFSTRIISNEKNIRISLTVGFDELCR